MASARTIASSYYTFENNSINLRDDSFSSYLALIRQSFSSDLTNPNSRRSSFSTTVVPRPTRPSEDDGELDVFGAEKYFSGTLDDIKHNSDYLISETMSRSEKTNKSGTRSRYSTCSDTSTNSHSMLLCGRRPQQQQQREPSPAPRCRNLLDVFCCPCPTKSAVNVEDDADIDQRPNKSSRELPRVPMGTLCSEPSSDLFEIDSMYMGSIPAYEPSEVSVEWSVTTASAANFSSVSERVVEGRKVRRSSGLLGFGCVSDKAVRSMEGSRLETRTDRFKA